MTKQIRAHDIVETYVAYPENVSEGKQRTLLVMKSYNNGQIISALNITSKYANKPKHIKAYYFPLVKHWKEYGLKEPSHVDIRSRTTVYTKLMNFKYMGHLPNNVINKMIKFTGKYYLNLGWYKPRH